ncbi:MAG: hypothetical protein ABL993_01355 [Vicinamibacterales bacterium]
MSSFACSFALSLHAPLGVGCLLAADHSVYTLSPVNVQLGGAITAAPDTTFKGIGETGLGDPDDLEGFGCLLASHRR